MPSIASITDLVKRGARDAGFELAGIAPVRDFDELAYFPAWIDAGHAGEMKYMEARDEAGRLKRSSLRVAAPWARSVIVCAINYNTAQPYSTQTNDPTRGWISRYAWGQEDYHDAVLKKLRGVEKQLTDAVASTHKANSPGSHSVRAHARRVIPRAGATSTPAPSSSGSTRSTPASAGSARTPAC